MFGVHKLDDPLRLLWNYFDLTYSCKQKRIYFFFIHISRNIVDSVQYVLHFYFLFKHIKLELRLCDYVSFFVYNGLGVCTTTCFNAWNSQQDQQLSHVFFMLKWAKRWRRIFMIEIYLTDQKWNIDWLFRELRIWRCR